MNTNRDGHMARRRPARSAMVSLEIRRRREAEAATARAEAQLKADLAELSFVEAQVSQLQQRDGVSAASKPTEQRKIAWTEAERAAVRKRTEAEKLRKEARLEREARRQREYERIVGRRRRSAGAFVTNLLEGRERWVCGDTEAAVFLLEEALAQYKDGLFSDRPPVTDFPGSEQVAAGAGDMAMLACACALLGLSLAAEPTIHREGHTGRSQRAALFASKNTAPHKKAHTDPASRALPGVSELQRACRLSPRVFGESTALSPLSFIFSYKYEKSLCGAGGALWLAPSADHSVIDTRCAVCLCLPVCLSACLPIQLSVCLSGVLY